MFAVGYERFLCRSGGNSAGDSRFDPAVFLYWLLVLSSSGMCLRVPGTLTQPATELGNRAWQPSLATELGNR
ncbi:MAG: hypothetical protein ACI8UD_000737, partial [Planctomycetota bacterium]